MDTAAQDFTVPSIRYKGKPVFPFPARHSWLSSLCLRDNCLCVSISAPAMPGGIGKYHSQDMFREVQNHFRYGAATELYLLALL